MVSALPFSYPFDLLSVQKAEREENFTVPEAACRAIAEAYNVDGIEDFTARFRLTRIAKDEYALEGHFSAAVLQTCILTLKPMRTLTEQDFERRYDIVPSRTAKKQDSAAIVELDSEDRETLQGMSLDLAIPLLEELSLSINPYPKIEGAQFEGDFGESASEESPFGVLRLLKDKMEPPEKT